MITLFPAGCDDELDFSLFARYCARKPYTNQKAFAEELFGRNTVVATAGLISHISYLVSQLAPGHHYSADSFIEKHTLFPYYSLFLNPYQATQLREDMCNDNGPGMHMRAGLMASKIPLPSFLKLCSACIEQDREQYGFCYWHRKHQPFGVEVCAVHGIPLLRTKVTTHNRQARYEFVTAEQAVSSMGSVLPPASLPFHDVLLAIARSVAWTLEQKIPPPGLEHIRERYLALLDEQGYLSADRHVRMEDLYRQFHATYPSDLLRLLCCELDDTSEDTWLTRLVRKPKHSQHPLYHLLFMHFLGHSAASFFAFSPEKKTFGEGPWPCLNSTCNDYRQLIVRSCAVYISRDAGGQPIGIFECPSCGFTYTRTWSSEIMDPFNRQRIINVGWVWEACLRERWSDAQHSLRAIARELDVDPNTVKAHATRLGLPFPRPGGVVLPSTKPQFTPTEANLEETYRQIWLQALQEHPDAGVKTIRGIVPARVYTWLYRHNKEWLDEHAALGRGKYTRPSRVDWNERDRMIQAEVRAAAQELLDMSGRPRQITIAAIGHHTGYLVLLQKHLDKLPLTHEALVAVVETQLSWGLRRIRYVVEEACRENSRLQLWQLIRAAGVARLLGEVAVQEALSQGMQKIVANKS